MNEHGICVCALIQRTPPGRNCFDNHNQYNSLLWFATVYNVIVDTFDPLINPSPVEYKPSWMHPAQTGTPCTTEAHHDWVGLDWMMDRSLSSHKSPDGLYR